MPPAVTMRPSPAIASVPGDVDPGLDIGVAGLADAADAAVADADIGFDDAPMVEDYGVGDDGVDRTLGAGRLALPHAVADHLAAAELDLLAIDCAVALDLDDKVGVGQPQPIPGRRPEHRGIGAARDAGCHRLNRAGSVVPAKAGTQGQQLDLDPGYPLSRV